MKQANYDFEVGAPLNDSLEINSRDKLHAQLNQQQPGDMKDEKKNR